MIVIISGVNIGMKHRGWQLERWDEAVTDYDVLRRELPHDKDVAESLFHAQVALMKSRGEEVHDMKFGGEVKLVSSLEQFKTLISSGQSSFICASLLFLLSI